MSTITCRLCGEIFDNTLTKCPLCGGEKKYKPLSYDNLMTSAEANAPLFTPVVRAPAVNMETRTTEQLEEELRDRSAAIERHQAQFQQVRVELKRRREVKDEQPTPMTEDQQIQANRDAALNLQNNLVLKVTAMEAEQAKLVVEAEMFKAQRAEAEEKLALVVKHMKREPMTREAARELALQRMISTTGGAGPDDPEDWIIDLIVEASK